MASPEELERMSPEEIAELQRQNCLFCKIEKGEVPSQVILKSEVSMAILDIRPAQKGHALVYPKEHVPVLPMIPRAILDSFWLDVQRVSGAVREGALVRGTQVFVGNGVVAGQQSPHCIAHIIPFDNNPHVQIPERVISGQDDLAKKLKERLGIRETKSVDRSAMLAAFLQSNDEARRVIIEDPEKAAALIAKDVEAQALFQGVDLVKLGGELRRMAR